MWLTQRKGDGRRVQQAGKINTNPKPHHKKQYGNLESNRGGGRSLNPLYASSIAIRSDTMAHKLPSNTPHVLGNVLDAADTAVSQ